MKGTYSICDYCKSLIANNKCQLCNDDICESHTNGLSLTYDTDRNVIGFITVNYKCDYVICRRCKENIDKNIRDIDHRLSLYEAKEKDKEDIRKIRKEILDKLFKIFKEECEVLNL